MSRGSGQNVPLVVFKVKPDFAPSYFNFTGQNSVFLEPTFSLYLGV